MIVNYSKSFIKQFKKSPQKIKSQLIKRLELFSKNPSYLSLHNHSLSGEYLGYRSINVSGDWRAIYVQMSENAVLFIALGTHSQLYK